MEDTLSVLDRVKRFLPILKEANEVVMKKMRTEGGQAFQIDDNMIAFDNDPTDASQLDSQRRLDDDNEEEEIQDDYDDQEDDVEEGLSAFASRRTIQLEFAVGNFEHSMIANLEGDDDEDDDEVESYANNVISDK